MKKKNEINYVYFISLFAVLIGLSAYHYMAQPVTNFSIFFFVYAIGQAFFEICLCTLIAVFLKRFSFPWLFLTFISISFIFLLGHYTNFTMVRLMDSTIFYIFKFFFCAGIDHLVASFFALNINAKMIVMTVSTIFAIPLIGLSFYWATHFIAKKWPFRTSLNQIILALAISGTTLVIADLIVWPLLSSSVYAKYQKMLPLGTIFLPPKPQYVALSSPLPEFRDEEKTLQNLTVPEISHRPNIYFFVIETLRNDFLNAAPHLQQFGAENIQIPISYANSNSTHLSWFALFHADLPFHWTSMRDSWKKGSIPLQILKKMGYKIHVYSSADLRYFGMDKLLFGSERELVDTFEEYTFDRTAEACDRDAMALASMKRDLASKGHAYFIFLDSTHSEYSFPKNFPLKYQPISKEIDYLSIGPKSPKLELIKNRYRNAIHYIDHLLGDFFETLKKEHLYEDAIITITGDHGEEFFEEGALFHGSHLNKYQTNVPILMKFPSKMWRPQTEIATHIDLFPSILHYLTFENRFASFFDGRSIFTSDQLPYRIAVLQNGAEPPVEFSIQNNDLSFHGKIADVFKLEIIELQGSIDSDIFAPLFKKNSTQ